jgi:multicomponent Na+:H+ antiporter subunit G
VSAPALLLDLLASLLLLAGCGFYFAGTIGLLRFPDTHSRLHALTKADNLGLLLVCAALALQARSLRVLGLLAVIWLLGLLAASISAHLLARRADRRLELAE